MAGNGRGQRQLPAANDVEVMFLVISRGALGAGEACQEPRFPSFPDRYDLFLVATKLKPSNQTERVETVRRNKTIPDPERGRIGPGVFHETFFRQFRFWFLQKILNSGLAVELVKVRPLPRIAVLLDVRDVNEQRG